MLHCTRPATLPLNIALGLGLKYVLHQPKTHACRGFLVKRFDSKDQGRISSGPPLIRPCKILPWSVRGGRRCENVTEINVSAANRNGRVEQTSSTRCRAWSIP